MQAHLGKTDLFPLGTGEDGGCIQLCLVCFQFEIQADGFFCLNGNFLRYISEVRTEYGVLPCRNREGIETYAIGGDSRFMVFQEYDGLLERLSGFCIPDIAGNRKSLNLGLDDTREQREDSPEYPPK